MFKIPVDKEKRINFRVVDKDFTLHITTITATPF